MQSLQSYKKYSTLSREGPKKASGLASNLSRLDLIPTTRSKLLRQMGIGRSIRTETGKGCKICRRGVSAHHR